MSKRVFSQVSSEEVATSKVSKLNQEDGVKLILQAFEDQNVQKIIEIVKKYNFVPNDAFAIHVDDNDDDDSDDEMKTYYLKVDKDFRKYDQVYVLIHYAYEYKSIELIDFLLTFKKIN